MPSQASAISAKQRRSRKPVAVEVPVRRIGVTAAWALALPLASAVLVAAATLLPRFPDADAARWGCLGAAGALLIGSLGLFVDATRRQRISRLK